jgi:hypothetical protein
VGGTSLRQATTSNRKQAARNVFSSMVLSL